MIPKKITLLILGLRFDDIIDECNRIIQINPKEANAYFYKGQAYFFQKKYKQAIQEINVALKLNPELFYVDAFIGQAYYSLGNYELAIKYLSREIEKESNVAGVYFLRAKAYEKLNKKSNAIADFKKAKELDPTIEQVVCADSTNGDKEVNQSVEVFYKAAYNSTSFPEYYYKRGVLFSENTEYEKAIKDFTKAINLKTGYGRSL